MPKMTLLMGRVRRAIMPAAVFLSVIVVHFLWSGIFPERHPAQEQWATVFPEKESSWLSAYVENQKYWLGYSYALALTFAAVAMRRFRENRTGADRRFAIGGVTLTGVLAATGCFLIGCCGSPMLVVYLNLFGAAFLPLAKPLMAAITTVTVVFVWIWMNRKRSLAPSPAIGIINRPPEASFDYKAIEEVRGEQKV
jgi:hypothetical protein